MCLNTKANITGEERVGKEEKLKKKHHTAQCLSDSVLQERWPGQQKYV